MKDLTKIGNLFYFKKIDKNINPDLYVPISYEYWKMLRGWEPSKFTLDYEHYIQLKKEQYNNEVEHRKYIKFEIRCYMYNLHP